MTKNRQELYDAIRVGSRVVILIPAGKDMVYKDGKITTKQVWARKRGRAVMRGPGGWVLNMGGKYGTPGIATPDNTVEVL